MAIPRSEVYQIASITLILHSPPVTERSELARDVMYSEEPFRSANRGSLEASADLVVVSQASGRGGCAYSVSVSAESNVDPIVQR